MNKIVPDSIMEAITKERYDLKDRIKELETRLAHAEDRIDVYVAEEERLREFSLGHPAMCCNQCIRAIEQAEARIKELEAQLDAIKKIKVSREDVWGIRRARKAAEGKP